MISRYSLYQRDKTGAIKRILHDIVSVEIVEKINNSGSWTVKSKTSTPCPFEKGDGMILFQGNDYYYSGVMKKLEENYNSYSGLYEWQVSGASDLEYLSRRIVYPDPVNGSTTTVSNYVDSGEISTVIKKLIDKNLGVDAMEVRAEPVIVETGLGDTGDNVSVSIRFDGLFKAIVKLLDEQSMTIRVNWNPESRKIYYQIYNSQDLTNRLLFASDFNSVTSMDKTIEAPEGNYIVSAGQGEMTERNFAYAQNDDSIDAWGRIEFYHDMRSTNDDDLQTDADTTLAEMSDYQDGYSGEISQLDTMPKYRVDWNLGDIISVVYGGRVITERVMQVKTIINNTTEVVTPTIGTVPTGVLNKIFKQMNVLQSDVNQLQKVKS